MGCSLSICGIYGGTPNGRQLEELRQQFKTLYEETFLVEIDPKSIKTTTRNNNLLIQWLLDYLDPEPGA